jgi:mannose-6-phosphate isomerase-like protein (cupin superfamily)
MKTFTVGKQHVIVRAESADTNGVCAVLEMHHPPETGPPLHVHQHEAEGFFVLEGRYRFTLFTPEKEVREVSSGDFVMASRGIPHSFRSLGPELGKLLVYFTPAGAEAYFEESSQISLDDPDRKAKCKALNQRFGITIVPRQNQTPSES